jgi:Uma2 family endonuclease
MEMVRPRVSYADLECMPEDGRRYELYDGEVFVVPAPILRHQIVSQRLWWILDDYAKRSGGLAVISPMDVIFSQFDVVQPDVMFIHASRLNSVSLDARIQQAPDIVVEVLSPSTASNDRGRKMRMFLRYNVPEYWIVDPVAERIEIYSLAGTEYGLARSVSGEALVQSAVLSDLSFTASAIFPGRGTTN